MSDEDIFSCLKDVFGYDTFRAGQEKLVRSVLDGRDTLAVMPTGAGKSLAFQLPALLMDGVTIVISPLISLMKDQVASLNAAGVHAAYLNSSLTSGQFDKAIALAKTGRYKLVYVAPERLDTDKFLDFALSGNVNIPFIAVDEAHCVSQWGQDFRPSYLKIANFIERLKSRPVVGAYTATATAQVRRDITEFLSLKSPVNVTTGFDRDNLYFAVKKPDDKYSELLCYIREKEDAISDISGIVYCASRKAVDEVASKLCADGFLAARYHGGMDDNDRRINQDDFIYGRKPIMVATNAFGMGIDKPDVRFVVHYNMPKDMESYYQEAGRAGRDGEAAECLLLYSSQDVPLNRYLIDKDLENDELSDSERALVRQKSHERLRQMTFYCFSKYCLRSYILRYFGEKGVYRCDNCSVCLGYGTGEKPRLSYRSSTGSSRGAGASRQYSSLYDAEVVYGEDRGFASKSRSRARSKFSAYEALSEQDKQIFQALRNLRTNLARENGLHPYMVFSDRTLAQMSEEKPKDREAMLRINGVGENKYQRYGQRFLEILKNY